MTDQTTTSRRYRLGRPPAGWGGQVWSVQDEATAQTVTGDLSEDIARLLVAALNHYDATGGAPAKRRQDAALSPRRRSQRDGIRPDEEEALRAFKAAGMVATRAHIGPDPDDYAIRVPVRHGKVVSWVGSPDGRWTWQLDDAGGSYLLGMAPEMPLVPTAELVTVTRLLGHPLPDPAR